MPFIHLIIFHTFLFLFLMSYNISSNILFVFLIIFFTIACIFLYSMIFLKFWFILKVFFSTFNNLVTFCCPLWNSRLFLCPFFLWNWLLNSFYNWITKHYIQLISINIYVYLLNFILTYFLIFLPISSDQWPITRSFSIILL